MPAVPPVASLVAPMPSAGGFRPCSPRSSPPVDTMMAVMQPPRSSARSLIAALILASGVAAQVPPPAHWLLHVRTVH